MKRRHLRESAAPALNVTSLMDILTIILIFLIISFSSDEQEAVPPRGFDLPASTTQRTPKIAVKVTITEQDIQFDSNSFALADGFVQQADLLERPLKTTLAEMERETEALPRFKLAAGKVPG